MEERIEIREGERVLRMSNRHTLVRTVVRREFNGDPKFLRALSHVLRLEPEGGQIDADADRIVSATDEAILADFIVRHGIEDSRAADQPDQAEAQQLTAPGAPGRNRSQS